VAAGAYNKITIYRAPSIAEATGECSGSSEALLQTPATPTTQKSKKGRGKGLLKQKWARKASAN
jgi:hypothetical protein